MLCHSIMKRIEEKLLNQSFNISGSKRRPCIHSNSLNQIELLWSLFNYPRMNAMFSECLWYVMNDAIVTMLMNTDVHVISSG